MAVSISKRAGEIIQAEIRAMSVECEKLQGVNLAQGIGNIEAPQIVRLGAKEAIDTGLNTYTCYDGRDNLRNSIATKLSRYNGITVDPNTQITVSAGSTGAFYCACLALLNPGDEVILFEPYYTYHLNTLLAVGAVPAYVHMDKPYWSFKPNDLSAALTPHTKAIMVCTPGNPSGKVFSQTELEWIADFANQHDLVVFTDEIYEYFVYDGRRHISPASIPGMLERTVTISGYSKTFGVTGWRIGYCVAPPQWAQMIGYINDLVYVCAPAPLQHGVSKGIDELSTNFYSQLSSSHEAKRDKLCKVLKSIELPPLIPQGSYYILADISRLPGETATDKAMFLLKKTGVACVSGDAFFNTPQEWHMGRFCFGVAENDLNEASNRLVSLT